MERGFHKKIFFEMTERERRYDALRKEKNLDFLQSLIKKHQSLKFQKELESNQEILVTPGFKEKKRVTFFDEKGPISHREYSNLRKLAQRLEGELYNQSELIPEKVKN